MMSNECSCFVFSDSITACSHCPSDFLFPILIFCQISWVVWFLLRFFFFSNLIGCCTHFFPTSERKSESERRIWRVVWTCVRGEALISKHEERPFISNIWMFQRFWIYEKITIPKNGKYYNCKWGSAVFFWNIILDFTTVNKICPTFSCQTLTN